MGAYLFFGSKNMIYKVTIFKKAAQYDLSLGIRAKFGHILENYLHKK